MEQDSVQGRLDQAKWHLLRYDNLQAATASRAATVLSANTLVLAGITVLVSQSFRESAGSPTSFTFLVVSFSAAGFIFVALSVVAAAQGLLALRPWRSRFGHDMPMAPFFQHNETLSLLPTYPSFADRFKTISPDEELDGALIALWVRTKNMKGRNEKVRHAILFLFLAMIGLLTSLILLAAQQVMG